MLCYAVTDRAWLRGRTLASCVEDAIAGGATFIQLREKKASVEETEKLALELKDICATHHVPFVLDDDVELSKKVGADGVHVGQEDLACSKAREILGEDAIIGVSAQTVESVPVAQVQAGVRYAAGHAFAGDPAAVYGVLLSLISSGP